MIIGNDYPKIELFIFNLKIQEPNVVISNLLMIFVVFVFLLKLTKKQPKNNYNTYWRLFFIYYSLAFFFGAISHAFYHYFSIYGKIPVWITSVVGIYFSEKAMISISKKKDFYEKLIKAKAIVVLASILILCLTQPVHEKPSIAFLPITINTIVGMLFVVLLLSKKYAKEISADFNFFIAGVLCMLPSAPIFLLKINIHPWLDKNDLSHLFLSIGLAFFGMGVLKTRNKLTNNL